MVLMTAILFIVAFLMLSGYGKLRLGRDDEKPEFSNVTWITMMFAVGMGVGLFGSGIFASLIRP